MSFDVDTIYKSTMDHYNLAKKKLRESRLNEYQASAVSDRVPDFKADKLEFGAYEQGKFAVLFVDMRYSTERARRVGPQKTFLTMHVFLTALLEVVKNYQGKVIDIMGDGLMVFWGGKVARENEDMIGREAVKNASKCGLAMMKIRTEVINRIITDENLGSSIDIGVGITFDRVIVTKIGINDTYDVKAFGDCVNTASKYSERSNKIKVSKEVKELWPSSKNGKLHFIQDQDGYLVE